MNEVLFKDKNFRLKYKVYITLFLSGVMLGLGIGIESIVFMILSIPGCFFGWKMMYEINKE